MTQGVQASGSSFRNVAWDGTRLVLEDIGAPLAVCDGRGYAVGLSPQAAELLSRLGIVIQPLPCRLPGSLWSRLKETPVGQAIQWYPATAGSELCLGCTRYPLGQSHAVVLMREVSSKHAEISRRLHEQRLQITGRLVASIAHDVRTCVAAIVYNAAFLGRSWGALSPVEIREVSQELCTAGKRLETIVERLLGFAKLGPDVSELVSISDAVERASALARPLFRERGHQLKCSLPETDYLVRGNALVLDQVLLNLLVNATEASKSPIVVRIATQSVAAHPGAPDSVEIVVEDNGPGIDEHLRNSVFQPFFTTRDTGTGLGLTTAREAARDLGGNLVLAPSPVGARFVVSLPLDTRTGVLL